MEFESGARAELTDIAEIEITSSAAALKQQRAQPRFRPHCLGHDLIASIFSEWSGKCKSGQLWSFVQDKFASLCEAVLSE